jgi:hypothetical protein
MTTKDHQSALNFKAGRFKPNLTRRLFKTVMTAMDVDAPKGETKDEQTTTVVVVEDVPHAVRMR